MIKSVRNGANYAGSLQKWRVIVCDEGVISAARAGIAGSVAVATGGGGITPTCDHMTITLPCYLGLWGPAI